VSGLKSLRRPEDVARDRGKTIMEVLPFSRRQVDVEDSEAALEPAPVAVAVEEAPIEPEAAPAEVTTADEDTTAEDSA
jgi:hypothetical protein